jgi:hypothetical protein
MGAGTDSAIYLRSKLVQRQNLFGQACMAHGAGHAPHNASGFVLGQDPSTRLTDEFAATQSVLAHSCQYDAESPWAVHLGDGTEEHVHRWPAGVLRKPLVHAQPHTINVFFHLHMETAWRDPDLSWSQHSPRLAFTRQET